VTRPIRIASWNIRKAVGLDWRRDPQRILRVLDGLRADIVLLQEADKRLAPRYPALPLDLVREQGWTFLDADPAKPSIGHHGNAILLREGGRVTYFEALDLPGLEPRGAVVARVSGWGGEISVGALHLGLRRKDRLRQMRFVLEAAERVGPPAVLGGDLNEWRANLQLVPETSTWTEVAPGPSFHSNAPRFRLDRFAVTPEVTVLGSGVLSDGEARRASDHLPVWIEVRP
jgi:endonuclease/exonuclease/phosphatase family metal-dependent hydrolase